MHASVITFRGLNRRTDLSATNSTGLGLALKQPLPAPTATTHYEPEHTKLRLINHRGLKSPQMFDVYDAVYSHDWMFFLDGRELKPLLRFLAQSGWLHTA